MRSILALSVLLVAACEEEAVVDPELVSPILEVSACGSGSSVELLLDRPVTSAWILYAVSKLEDEGWAGALATSPLVEDPEDPLRWFGGSPSTRFAVAVRDPVDGGTWTLPENPFDHRAWTVVDYGCER